MFAGLIAARVMSESKSGFEGERIAKAIARAGVCSRRDAEAMILEGRVSVNGKKLTSPALNVTDSDDIRVDGKPLPAAGAHAPVPLLQAARPGHHRQGPARAGRRCSTPCRRACRA